MAKYERSTSKPAPASEFNPIVNSTVLARLFGVTMETLRQWRIDGLPDEGKTGKSVRFDVRKAIAWRVQRAANAETPDDSKARKLKAEAERLEMQNAETRGELVRRDTVEREAREEAETLKQAMMNIPPRLAQILANESNAALVEAALAEAIADALSCVASIPVDEESEAA